MSTTPGIALALCAALCAAPAAGATDGSAPDAVRPFAERGAPLEEAPSQRHEEALADWAGLDALAAASRRRWERSAHGQMLERILPPRLVPSALPEAHSRGARLVALYCVQCHHLPNPAMHDAERWARVVERMVPRMQGQGNMGALMSKMMRGPGAGQPLAAPTREEAATIVAYLRRHAMRALPPDRVAVLDSLQGRSFELACGQCHALPDPRAHTPLEWPGVVRRMQENMAWMNRVVGSRSDPREPQLAPAEIVRFLQRHAR
ncbi:MAG: hypothetical protein KJZ83_18430 [Burkholderiaceae bacterium]|nr:hypothetical protein [Burkholderiaceae bacterium]